MTNNKLPAMFSTAIFAQTDKFLLTRFWPTFQFYTPLKTQGV